MAKSKSIQKQYHYEDMPSNILEEPAVKYQSLHAILGGGKNLKKTGYGDFDLIALTREGINKSALRSLAAYLGISLDTMSGLLHTSYRNLQRKDDNELLDSLKTEKVLELAALAQRGIEVIGSREAFSEWLHSPLIALSNKSPLDFLDTSFGIQLVAKVLGRLEQGVYS